MALKLYFDAMSQPCRSLMIFMRCANIEYTPTLIDLTKGGNRTDEYKQIHPDGKVPAIDDDGFTLFESVAIFQHLCRTRDVADHWYPKDVQKRAKIDEYLNWHHTCLRLGAGLTFQTTTLRPMLTGKPPNERDVGRYSRMLSSSLDTIDTYFLSKTDFISSNDISIADLMAITELSQLEVMGENTPALPQKIIDWKERCIIKTTPHYHDMHKVMYKVKNMLAMRSKI